MIKLQVYIGQLYTYIILLVPQLTVNEDAFSQLELH